MPNKTWLTWETTKAWCKAHPNTDAAVVTPEGMFTITFIPHKDASARCPLTSPSPLRGSEHAGSALVKNPYCGDCPYWPSHTCACTTPYTDASRESRESSAQRESR